MRAALSVAALVVVAVAITLGVRSCEGDGGHHKALCWTPAYAAAPTASWAKHPSPTHRHGTGPRGSDICDGK